jgi:hypothetical protein
MKKKKRIYRFTIEVSGREVKRLRIKERSKTGEFVTIERPWGESDLIAVKKAAKAVTTAASGVTDLDEACRIASAGRRSYTRKKPVAARPVGFAPSHRELLVKTLGMLGSGHEGERANAASSVEKQRASLGATWNDLIVPAEADANNPVP